MPITDTVEARRQGIAAYLFGEGLDANPFAIPALGQAWTDGWRIAAHPFDYWESPAVYRGAK